MALANVAILLSQWGNRVLVVDWDLEAPGIERYFEEMIPGSSQEVHAKNGIIEMADELRRKGESRWKDSVIRFPVPGASGQLDFLSAGRRDDGYVERLQRLDWEALFQDHDFGRRLETIRNEWQEEYDHVLIDSRTGITDIGGICTIYLPDVLVALFTANHQSVEGVADVISRARRARSSLPVDRGALVCVPVPARDESRTEYEQSIQWRNIYYELFSQLYADFLPRNVSAVDALDLLRIPNVPFWSFGERLPVLTESASDPSGITYYYTILARLLATDLSWQNSAPSATATLGADSAISNPAAVAAPPGTHNLPRRPARVFVGRQGALRELSDALTGDASAAVTQAVYGLGGVGKSELALQHASGHQADYNLIWWITAEDPAQIQAGLAALAARLYPQIATAGTTEDAAGWATGWLQAHHGWLLILDNVNDPADVEPLLGQLTGGHVLITTRRDTGWDQIASSIRLDVLDPGPAAELLITRTSSHGQPDQDAAAAVAAELGYLPLALDQAAAYISQTRITLAAYLQRLRQVPAAMYAAGGGQAQLTIARMWDITIDAIRARHPAALKLLRILACYAPDAVPRTILGGREDTNKLAVDEALGVLASYSMIVVMPEAVNMNKLVQAVILAMPPSEDGDRVFGGESALTTALEWLDDAIPEDPAINLAGWPLLRALLPHAQNIARLFPAGDLPIKLGRVQSELAMFQDSQGQYEQALTLRESALTIYEATLGSDHPDTATALAGVGLAYWRLGQADKALPLQQRALAITEAALGPDHPDTAIQLDNLALSYSDLGQADQALPLQQRALMITEAALGPDHPDTAIRLDNLATTYRDLGQADQALPLQQRALAITEAALGPDHPDTAIRLDNLALAYRDLGQADQALPLQQRALAITEAALGPDHPDTAIRLDNLATTYRDLGQADKALPLQQRVKQITNRNDDA
jgi:tetratricopeptide (TPR) repeat protein/MinD-like ATPase involved in chromosome partitioning or flagellar assembly